MNSTSLLLALFAITFLSSCAVIKPGEVGVKQKFGKLSKNVQGQGAIYTTLLLQK